MQRVLLDKEMTRKEFLQYVGGTLVVLSGLPNFIALLHARVVKPLPTRTAATELRKFGTRKFGV